MQLIAFDIGIVFLIIVCVYILKNIIKYKPIYPLLSFGVALLIGVVYSIILGGTLKEIALSSFQKMFIYGASAISLYDLVLEKIEKVMKKKEGENEKNISNNSDNN